MLNWFYSQYRERESHAEREEKSEEAELLQGCKAKQKSAGGENISLKI